MSGMIWPRASMNGITSSRLRCSPGESPMQLRKSSAVTCSKTERTSGRPGIVKSEYQGATTASASSLVSPPVDAVIWPPPRRGHYRLGPVAAKMIEAELKADEGGPIAVSTGNWLIIPPNDKGGRDE